MCSAKSQNFRVFIEKGEKSGPTCPCSNAKGRKTGPTARCPVTNRAEYPMGNNQAGWAQFVEFANNSQIGAFDPARSPAPKRAESYNGDVVLPLYESSMRSYAVTHRKGIRDERPTSTNAHEHGMGAMQAPFFLAQSAPIPPSTDKAVEFRATSCHGDVSAFWKKQLGRSEEASDVQRGVASSWDACRPKELMPLKAAKVLMLDFLMRRFKLGGGRWVDQLVSGFPITGSLSHDSTYPRNEEVTPPL